MERKENRPSSKRIRREQRSVPTNWQLQNADAAVVLSAEEYERLSKGKKQQGSLVRFFADSPLADSGIDLGRRRDFGRAIPL